MKTYLFVVMASATLAASASAATTVLQQDFTSAQVNTLPTGLSASFDGGTDVAVVPYTSVQPTPPTDHTNGDGHVLRVGDVGSGGGGYDFAFPTTAATLSNVALEAWCYISTSNFDATPQERDYMILLRMQNTDPQVTGAAAGVRQAYFFAITQNSSWGGITPNPANAVPIIFKRVGTTHTRIAEGTTPVTQGWHLLKAIAAGTTLSFYVDGALAISGTDAANSYPSGSYAVGVYEDNGATAYSAAYDNLLVQSFTSGVSDWSVY